MKGSRNEVCTESPPAVHTSHGGLCLTSSFPAAKVKGKCGSYWAHGIQEKKRTLVLRAADLLVQGQLGPSPPQEPQGVGVCSAGSQSAAWLLLS